MRSFRLRRIERFFFAWLNLMGKNQTRPRGNSTLSCAMFFHFFFLLFLLFSFFFLLFFHPPILQRGIFLPCYVYVRGNSIDLSANKIHGNGRELLTVCDAISRVAPFCRISEMCELCSRDPLPGHSNTLSFAEFLFRFSFMEL